MAHRSCLRHTSSRISRLEASSGEHALLSQFQTVAQTQPNPVGQFAIGAPPGDRGRRASLECASLDPVQLRRVVEARTDQTNKQTTTTKKKPYVDASERFHSASKTDLKKKKSPWGFGEAGKAAQPLFRGHPPSALQSAPRLSWRLIARAGFPN